MDNRCRHERHRPSLILDYVRTGLPSATCRHCAAYGSRSFFHLCSFRILPSGNLLFDRRADVLPPLAVRACDDMVFARPTATRRRYRSLCSLDPDISGWIFDALLLRVSMAGHCCISLDCARKTYEAKTGSVSIRDRCFNFPMVHKTPGEPCHLANYTGLAEMATAGILSLGCITRARGSALFWRRLSNLKCRRPNSLRLDWHGHGFASAYTGIRQTSAFALAFIHRCLRGSSRF